MNRSVQGKNMLNRAFLKGKCAKMAWSKHVLYVGNALDTSVGGLKVRLKQPVLRQEKYTNRFNHVSYIRKALETSVGGCKISSEQPALKEKKC